MSSPQFAAPLVLEPGPSRRLAAGLALVGGATLVLVAYLPLHGGWRVALALVVAISGWYSIVVHALRHGSEAIVQLTWDGDNHWFVRRRAGHVQQVTLLGDSLVLSWLVVLNFKPERGRRFSVVLFGDSLPPDRFRQLRMRLRISGVSEGNGSNQT